MRLNRAYFAHLLDRLAMLGGVTESAPPALRQAHEGASDPIAPETRFEPRDINVVAVLFVGLGLLLVLWIVVVGLYPLFAYFEHQRAETPRMPASARAHPLPPEPRIQADPHRDWQDMLAYENYQLNGYHWINKAQGIVSMPIEEAMKIIAARGIPPQPQPPGLTYFTPEEGTRETGFEGKVEPR